MSVLITIDGGKLNSINLSHMYIQKHFNKITKAVPSTIKQKWTASKNLLVHWDDKINPTLDGTLKEKRLLVSVLGKEHKLLGTFTGIFSLGKNFQNIYGKRDCEEVINLLKKMELCEQHLRYGF